MTHHKTTKTQHTSHWLNVQFIKLACASTSTISNHNINQRASI